VTEYRLHGPPGCGKSHSLATKWVPRAAERFGPGNVVICSLTKTAAAEIGSRDLPIPKDNVGTLHALAYRALGRPEIAESHVADFNEAEPMFRMTGAAPSVESPELRRTERSSTGDDLMAMAQVYRHNRTPIANWRDDVRIFQRRWDDWMERNGLVDFTGLIERAYDEVPYAPNNPAVFVVDEAQDCSVAELDLVRRWSEWAEYTVLAGDGDQAIYGWRGASAKAFLGGDIPAENNYHLTQSYRVPRAVHAAAREWIRRASYRYAVEYHPRDEEGILTTNRGNARMVEPVIEAMLDDVANGRTVMLLATCGYMLRNALAVLRREGVPFHNPYRPTQGAWNPLRGGAGRLLAFLRPDRRVYGDDARTWTWDEAATWVEVLASRGVMATSGKTMVKQQAQLAESRFRVIEDGDGRACFGASWDAMRNAFENNVALDWLADHLLPSKAKAMDYALTVARKRGAAALRDEPGVCIGTVHSVKGAQADAVYMLPDLSTSGMREWTSMGEGRDSIIRTWYVGMTRARHKLAICGRWSASSIDWVPR
jgi:DNA helicase-2/ATP-dependent DNA helicase PcrA